MRFEPIDLSGVKTVSLRGRRSKVNIRDFAKAPFPGGRFLDFVHSLPNILVGDDFKDLVSYLVKAARNGRTIAIGIGGHVIKCGLAPVLIELMKRKVISAVAMNGAAAIHDLEIAMIGATSEDVVEGLVDGSFGMAKETGDLFNEAAKLGEKGLGASLGERIEEENLPFKKYSLLWNAFNLGVTTTVHVAIGTDIVHQQPSCDGGAIGRATYTDFKIFCSVVASLEGGAYLNFGSAVILPEVFLKALTIARNLGYEVRNFVTANFDIIQHYRPRVNVVDRPTRLGGKGYLFTGHHEIMIPLLAWAVISEMEKNGYEEADKQGKRFP